MYLTKWTKNEHRKMHFNLKNGGIIRKNLKYFN